MRKAHNSKIKIQNCAKRTIEQFKIARSAQLNNSKCAKRTIQNSKLKNQNCAKRFAFCLDRNAWIKIQN